ncbi:YihY family inner membrane protein [Motiliproteus sediminis]|uniref:YihY family inner membrane protein n=1 Tax=Motiliproteus sediminis TaxID=1468178 RepID=UPI001AEFC547|nr:YihY family inner membrane protein [Motiliproteus sediminis]
MNATERLPQAVRHAGLFLRMLVHQFGANQGALNAAALTYTTLFAVVPLMTVTYSMLASIPSFQGVGEQLEGLLFDHFVPSSGESIRGHLSGFATQARTLTAVGIGFLIVTAFLMLKSIEGTFNRIWRVDSPRKGLSSFLLYWAVLSLGPLLLGLGFVLTSYLASLPLISDASEILGGRQGLLSLLPFVTSTAAFTLLYAAVPNCRVPLRHALAGGVLVALLFEAAKRSFTLFVTHFPSYELIYGAFAAVPLFLAWIYITWIIVLLGAELVRGLSSFTPLLSDRDHRPLYWVLRLLEQLWQAQLKGKTLSASRLRAALPGLHADPCGRYLSLLHREGIITRTEQGRYTLCRDLSQFTVDALCRHLPWPIADTIGDSKVAWRGELERRLAQLKSARNAQLGVSLAALFSAADTEKNLSEEAS